MDKHHGTHVLDVFIGGHERVCFEPFHVAFGPVFIQEIFAESAQEGSSGIGLSLEDIYQCELLQAGRVVMREGQCAVCDVFGPVDMAQFVKSVKFGIPFGGGKQAGGMLWI